MKISEVFAKYADRLNGGTYTETAPVTGSFEHFQPVEDGWADLVDSLIADLFKMGWNGHLAQIKEKFGALRFYIGSGSEEMSKRIDETEIQSHFTCEECGRFGVPRDTGWIKTLCTEHAEGARALNLELVYEDMTIKVVPKDDNPSGQSLNTDKTGVAKQEPV